MSGQRRILGRSVARLEDLPLLRGQGQFVADIAFPHQLHMRIVRAPYAHGELRSVDVAAARAAPGVAAVWSGAIGRFGERPESTHGRPSLRGRQRSLMGQVRRATSMGTKVGLMRLELPSVNYRAAGRG
jgi:CO/xanthine dehydrogenase Mo-binding subunit